MKGIIRMGFNGTDVRQNLAESIGDSTGGRFLRQVLENRVF